MQGKEVKLIRPINLVITAVTLYFVQYFLILPALNAVDFLPLLSHWQFALLVLSAVIIMAAGYVINDYFDIRIDQINKPDQMVIGKSVPRRKAIILHWALNGLAVLLALYLASEAGMLRLVLLQVMAIFMLWKYSELFKRKFATGNIMIAFLTALIVMLPALYESIALITFYKYHPVKASWLSLNILAYAIFAFLTTFMREVIKDMEDLEGDLEVDCKTIPIVLGIGKSKRFIAFLMLVSVGLIACYQYFKFGQQEMYVIYYCIIALQLPFIYTAFKLLKAETKKEFAHVSSLLKIVMSLGILSIPIFYAIKYYL